MTESNPIKPYKRILYAMGPLLFLIVCLGFINLFNWWQHRSQIDDVVQVTAVSTPTNNQLVSNSPTPLPTATNTVSIPSPTPSATVYKPPQFPAGTNIQLLGPPQNAIFNRQQQLLFYWHWPLALTEDQFFTVTIFHEGETIELGIVNKENLGTNYQWQQDFDDLPQTGAQIQWQVILFSSHDELPLAVSDPRFISLR